MSLLTKVTEVFQKIIEQGGRCENENGCAYTSTCGTRHCAVGHLLTADELWNLIDAGLNDNTDVITLCEKIDGLDGKLALRLEIADESRATIRDVLCSLQETHDGMAHGESVEMLLAGFKRRLLCHEHTEHLAEG